ITNEIVQTGITDETDRFYAGSLLSSDDTIRILLRHGERVIRNQIGTRRAERPRDDGKHVRNFYVRELVFRVAGWRVSELVDPVLMIVSGDKNHVGDVVFGDEPEQIITLRAIASYVGLATVGVDRCISASRSEARKIVQCQRAADRPDLVDWI